MTLAFGSGRCCLPCLQRVDCGFHDAPEVIGLAEIDDDGPRPPIRFAVIGGLALLHVLVEFLADAGKMDAPQVFREDSGPLSMADAYFGQSPYS